MSNLFSLHGKVALVTGASQGIGFAIANGLNLAGASVFGFGRSEKVKESQKVHFEYIQCDIRKNKEFQTSCKRIFDSTGSIDILINAAGITVKNQSKANSFDTFSTILDVNLRAAYFCCETVQYYMKSNTNGGSIINITSIASKLGFPENPGYVSSKGGLKMLTKALAIDYAKNKIRVNNIAPGYIKTSMTLNSFNDHKKYLDRKNHTILDRWGLPEDLIGAAIFLSSNASTYITGIDLVVDGGWTSKGL